MLLLVAPPLAAQEPPGPAPAAEERPEGTPAEAASRSSIGAKLPPEPPVYWPERSLVGDLEIREAGTPRRKKGPTVQVAAPKHVGVTTRGAPTLYWYLSRPVPHDIEFSVAPPRSADNLFEVTLPGPHEAGFHSLSLSRYDFQLPTHPVAWRVAVIVKPEDRSADIVSLAAIQRIRPSASLSRSLDAGPRRAHAYAQAGIWYDAFQQLSQWIGREPESQRLRDYRAALLEQVELDDLATSERGGATPELPPPS